MVPSGTDTAGCPAVLNCGVKQRISTERRSPSGPSKNPSGVAHQTELRDVGATQDDETGATDRGGQLAVGPGGVTEPLQQLAAVVVGLTGHGVAEVLQQCRHPPERAVRECAGGLGERPLEAAVDDGVQLSVEGLDPLDRVLDELAWRHLARSHELGEPRDARPGRQAAAPCRQAREGSQVRGHPRTPRATVRRAAFPPRGFAPGRLRKPATHAQYQSHRDRGVICAPATL